MEIKGRNVHPQKAKRRDGIYDCGRFTERVSNAKFFSQGSWAATA